MAVLTVRLGNWQLHRAAEKEAIQLRLERAAHTPAPLTRADGPAPAEWQSVSLTGSWLADATIYLDNRTYRGRAGYQVLTPLHLADGSGWVLVNRGWVAAAADRARLPAVRTSGGVQRLRGTVRRPPAAPFALTSEASSGALWQFLDLARYRARSGVDVAEWTVQQTSAADDGLVREWPQPGIGVDRHRGYALQWYSFAALALGLSGWRIWTLWRHRERGEQDHG